MQTRFFSVALGGLLALAAPGCFTVDEDDGPLLSIELLWQVRPGRTDDPFFGTCDEANVTWVDWTLFRVEPDGERVEVDQNSQPCVDFIDEIDLRAGDYEIEITGRDEDDEPRWHTICGEPGAFLTVVRFDVAYFCNVEGM